MSEISSNSRLVIAYLTRLNREINKYSVGEASAALAFHSLLALAPVLVLVISIGSLVVADADAVQLRIIEYLHGQFGLEPGLIEGVVAGMFDIMSGVIFTAGALILMSVSVVNLINHIREVFFRIFKVDVEGSQVMQVVKTRGISVLYAVLLFFSVLMIIGGHVLLAFLFSRFPLEFLPVMVIETFRFVLLTAVTSLVFFLIYRFMSIDRLPVSANWLGAVVAAVIITLINIGISIYISFAARFGVYEVLSSIIVFLFWIYLSAYAVFIGAVAARIHAEKIDARTDKEIKI